MMRRLTLIAVAALTAGFVLPSCDRGWPDAYWRSGDYTLIAIDAMAQMSLAHSSDSVSLVPSTVFAVGADDRFIVLKQHPGTGPGGFEYDRFTTNYFIVEKKKSSDFREIHAGVRGPLTEEEFDSLATSLSLPAFTKIFNELE